MIQVTFLRDFCATQNGDGYDAGEIATLSDDFANQLIAYRIAKPLTQPAPLKPYEVGCSNKWDFNVGLNDLKGTNNLTNYGATQNTGYYTFDGTGDYMTGSGPISLGTTFSIEFIANISATQPNRGAYLFSDWDAPNVESWFLNFGSDLHDFSFSIHPPSGYQALEFGQSVPNTPIHFVITSDGSTLIMYVNGTNAGSGSLSTVSITPSPSTQFYVGSLLGYEDTAAIACDLYLTRIFANTTLTSGQVLNNYNAEAWRI